MQLDLNYLKQLAPELNLTTEQIMESNGYDAIISLVSSARQETFPKIIIEGAEAGYISAVPGGIDISTISIWVMERRPKDQVAEKYYSSCKKLMLQLLKLLVRDSLELELDIERMPYYKRAGGMNSIGYEVMLTVKNNISLAYGE